MKTSNIEHRTSNAESAWQACVSFLLLLSLVILSGCAHLQPGADPLVVRTEQSLTVAQATFDTFLKLDNADRDLVKAKAPEVHAFAEWLRVQVPIELGRPVIVARWAAMVERVNLLKLRYEVERSAQNRDDLEFGLSSLSATVARVKSNLADLKVFNP